MTIAQNTAHVANGLDRLIGQYRGRPRMEAWVSSFLEEIQELDDAAWDVLISRTIDNAVDAQLTVLGKLVGQPRREESDDRFRVLVRARVAVNRSNGKPDELLRIAVLLLDSTLFEMTELYPASLLFDVAEECDFADLFFEMLNAGRAAGVGLGVHWFDGHDTDEALMWASGDDFEDDADQGFGGDDPDAGDGGLLIGAY